MRILLFNFILLALLSCNNIQPSNETPEIFRTNYDRYKDRKFELNFGDIVRINNTQYKGIICDLSEDEGGLWYGILYMDRNENLFSRSIPNGSRGNCFKLFDITYLNYKGQNSVTKIATIKLDFNKIGIGGRSPAINENDLIRNYLQGIEKRKMKETPCEEKMKLLEPVNENFRSLDEIKL